MNRLRQVYRALIIFEVSLLMSVPVNASDLSLNGGNWNMTSEPFKLGYVMAFRDAHVFLPLPEKSDDQMVTLPYKLGACIIKRSISPGQIIAMIDSYIAMHQDRINDDIFLITTGALVKACLP